MKSSNLYTINATCLIVDVYRMPPANLHFQSFNTHCKKCTNVLAIKLHLYITTWLIKDLRSKYCKIYQCKNNTNIGALKLYVLYGY